MKNFILEGFFHNTFCFMVVLFFSVETIQAEPMLDLNSVSGCGTVTLSITLTNEPGTDIVATSNDISILPPEAMRKGRFDEIFFIDLPTLEERREIFAIHLARRGREPLNFDLKALARQSEGFSGAEI